MADLSKLSDDELLALRNRVATQPADHLQSMSDAELEALRSQKAQSQPPHWAMDSVKALGAGAVRGIAALPGLPGDVSQLIGEGINWAGEKAGFARANLSESPLLPTSRTTVGALENNVTGPLYQAQTTPGKYAQTTGEFIAGAALPGGMMRRVVGGVMAPAFAAETAGQLAPKGYENIARAVGGIGGGVLGASKLPTLGANARADKILAEAATPQSGPRLQELGPEAFLFESNPTMTQVAQGVVQRPGPAAETLRTAVTQRHEATPLRLDQDVRTNFGPPVSPLRVDQRIGKAQNDLSAPYKVALHNSQPAEVDGILAALKGDISRNAGDPKGALEAIRGYFYDGNRLKSSAGELLAIRQAIDDLYKSPKYQTQNNTLRVIGEYRQAVDDALRKAAPMVKGVDADFETLARQRDALTQGGNVLATGKEAILPSQLAKDIAGYTPAQNATLRMGARAEIERILGTSVFDVNALRSVVKTEGKWNHEKLAQIFGKTEADNVMGAIDREAAFRKSYDALIANSQTAPRLAAAEATRYAGPGNLAPEAIAAAAGAVVTGSPAAAIPAAAVVGGARKAWEALTAGGQKRLDAALIDRLGLQGANRDAKIIDLLARQKKYAKPNATRDVLVRALLNSQLANTGTR